MKLPQTITEAILQLNKLPGVGIKTATRHVMSMSRWKNDEIEILASGLKMLSKLERCGECDLFSDRKICEICSDSFRKESATLCVVESMSDALAIENSGEYQGLYHHLGGVLNPLLGIGTEELNIKSLIERIDRYNFKEVILALNPSVEGDATSSYLKDILSSKVLVKRIGFGVPIGGNLEYLDPLTIRKAFENKKSL